MLTTMLIRSAMPFGLRAASTATADGEHDRDRRSA